MARRSDPIANATPIVQLHELLAAATLMFADDAIENSIRATDGT